MRRRELELSLGRALGTATALVELGTAAGTLDAVSRGLVLAARRIEDACVCAQIEPARLRELDAYAEFADAVRAAADVVRAASKRLEEALR